METKLKKETNDFIGCDQCKHFEDCPLCPEEVSEDDIVYGMIADCVYFSMYSQNY